MYTATVHGNVNTLTHAVNVIPTQEYIAGSFLDAIDSCKLEQAAPLLQEVTPIEYGANMLMIDGEKPIIGVTNDMSMNPFAEPPKQETTFDSIPFRARAYTDPSRPTPVRQREFMSHRPSDPPPFTGQLFDDVMAGYYAQRRSINAANAALNFPPMEFEHRNNNNNFGGVRPTGLSIHVDPLTQLQNIGQIQRIYAPSKRHVPQANTFRCNFHRCNSGPFSTYESLQSHIALHMSKPSRGKTYKCEKCPQMFSRSHGTFLRES